MVDFAGWQMPLHYGSQVEEHHSVRQNAGMFDVSHMGIVDLRGSRCRDMLRFILANDVAKLDKHPGKAIYSCMLNEKGGVIDDLIVQIIDPLWYRIVVNAGTRDKDLAWMRKNAESFDVRIELREDLAILALQGPKARELAAAAEPRIGELGEGLKRFSAAHRGDLFVSRTGYTGEDGYEIILPGDEIEELWLNLLDQGVQPCGLGARDTLRLEAGMNLYGTDMDEDTSPLISGLAWTVSLADSQRKFIGAEALQAGAVDQQFVGLLLKGRGVIRNHQEVYLNGEPWGEITSGGFSPTLKRSIAFARVGNDIGVSSCQVKIRDKLIDAHIVKLPFVREGKGLVDPELLN